MFTKIREFFSRKTQPLNKIYINPRALLHNFEYLQSLHPNNIVFPVIKSNAYWHGLKQVATILKDVPATYICIDSYPEYAIASKCNKHNYLVLSETNAENYKLYNWKRTAFAVSSLTTLQYFAKKRKPVRIHLFLDTWMHREGFSQEDLQEAIQILSTAPHITVEWVLSHLSDADSYDTKNNQEETTEDNLSKKTKKQIQNFKDLHKLLSDAGFTPRFRHIGASAGLLTISDPFFTAWRPGIALYGHSPLPENHPDAQKCDNLAPVARVTSTILAIKTIKQGETIGYNSTWKAPEDTNVALVPFGYYEWLPRNLSNSWYEKRDDQFLPMLGTISMNYHTIGLGNNQAQLGDEIEIYGRNIQTAAQITKTIPYEIMVKRNEKIKRIIKDDPL